MASDPRTAAVALLREHLDRRATGVLHDPAVVAAVVGVERIACAAGRADPDVLAAALDGAGDEWPDGDVAWTVADAVSHVAEALHARHVGRRPLAAVVNRDAGRHGIAVDAVLLRTAVRAGTRTWAAHPYMAQRYGRRGARFTTSDSAWLVGLLDSGEDLVVREVSWLAGVLAGRGMPSWLLEDHLTTLADAVDDATGQPDRAAVLAVAAEHLSTTRRRAVPDDVLSDAEQALTGAGHGQVVPRAGALVAAAVADVATGLVADDAVTVGWIAAQGPSSWGAAVRSLGDDVRVGVRDRLAGRSLSGRSPSRSHAGPSSPRDARR